MQSALSAPRRRTVRVEDTVLAYLADLAEQMEAVVRKKLSARSTPAQLAAALPPTRTGSQSPSVQ